MLHPAWKSECAQERKKEPHRQNCCPSKFAAPSEQNAQRDLQPSAAQPPVPSPPPSFPFLWHRLQTFSIRKPPKERSNPYHSPELHCCLLPGLAELPDTSSKSWELVLCHCRAATLSSYGIFWVLGKGSLHPRSDSGEQRLTAAKGERGRRGGGNTPGSQGGGKQPLCSAHRLPAAVDASLPTASTESKGIRAAGQAGHSPKLIKATEGRRPPGIPHGRAQAGAEPSQAALLG